MERRLWIISHRLHDDTKPNPLKLKLYSFRCIAEQALQVT